MSLLKVGQVSGKAASTVAASIHEADTHLPAPGSSHSQLDADTHSRQTVDSVVDPEYGQQIPGTSRYWTQSINGKPYAPQAPVKPLRAAKSGLVTAIPLPFDIYGSGHIKIMFLTGLGLARASWAPQLEYFARKPEYSCLVIDNRGFDALEAQIPLKIAGTKQNARDMKRALEDLGWSEPKSVHIVGFSMGGMIALQMGRVCPEYIASMHLVSTAAKYRKPPSEIGDLVNRLYLLKQETDLSKAERFIDLLFPPEFLYMHDPKFPEFKYNRARFLHRENIPILFSRKQNFFNFYSQILGCARHSMSQANLWEVAAKVRFLFVSGGGQDALFHPECTTDLITGLNAPGRVYLSGGHHIPWQYADELNADQEAMIQRAHQEYEEYPPIKPNNIDQTDSQDREVPRVVFV